MDMQERIDGLNREINNSYGDTKNLHEILLQGYCDAVNDILELNASEDSDSSGRLQDKLMSLDFELK